MPVLRALRPSQWVKNVLVFAAPGAAGVLGTADGWWVSWWVFVAFCLVSSSMYVVNDLADREEDRRHPVKCRRPIASGCGGGFVGGGVGVCVAGGGGCGWCGCADVEVVCVVCVVWCVVRGVGEAVR